MQNAKSKLEKLEPLLKLQTFELNKALNEVAQVKQMKIEVENELKSNQNQYINSIDRLNQLRASSDRQSLNLHEDSVNYYKQVWHSCYLKLKDLDSVEATHLEKLGAIQSKLKSLEKLQQKLKDEYKREISKREQKQLDEIGSRRNFYR